VEIFLDKKACFEHSRTLIKLRFATTEKPCFVAFFAYRIVNKKEQRTTGKTSMKPCVLEMVELVRGLEHKNKTEVLHMSNYVNHIRTADISLIF
jgi:hypothetical protein